MNSNPQVKMKPFDEIKQNLNERKSNHQSSSSITISDKNDIELVKTFAFSVCRDYLSGAWKNIDINDFKIQRVSGGLTNYLYKCEVPKEKFIQIDNEPNQILLRYFCL